MTRPSPFPLTRVGNDYLPELPSGWPVYFDTEGSGLYGDGDPIPAGSRPAQPEARVSVVSLSFRWPNEDGTPGDVVDFAWPFDQGPLIGKPGTPIKDPVTGVCTFKPIDAADQTRMLAAASKTLGRTITIEDAAPNLPVEDYVQLISWLDHRDFLLAHNAKHDFHTLRYGLRAGAGGNPNVPDGYAAWDADSEPGQWRLGEFQKLHMLEPTLEPLTVSATRRRVYCTFVVQKQLIAPLEPAALKKTGRRLWGDDATAEEEALKVELSKQGTGLTKRYDLLPWCGAMGQYAAKDTNLGFRLYEYQVACEEQGAVLPNYTELRDAENNLTVNLYRMERRAVAYDSTRSALEGENLRRLNAELADSMPFNPAKPAEAKRFYFGPLCPNGGDPTASIGFFCPKDCQFCEGKNGLGLEPTNRTEKTKAPQLDIEELRKLGREERPWAREYAAWTKRRNSDSKWYTGWSARTGRDGRIRTSFKQCKNDLERPGGAEGGAKSGRLAVGRWQAQAIPHGKLIPEGATPVRDLIGRIHAGSEVVRYDGRREVTPVPRTLFEHDLSAGEVRVVTVISGSTKFWDALDAGMDMHALNCKSLFGVTEDHPDWDSLRTAAKRGTFGIIYLGGVKAIHTQMEAASGMKFSQQAVADARTNFWNENPEIKRFSDQAVRQVTRWQGGPGYLRMLDGWRRWYALDEKTVSAPNQVIQGNLARAMIYWMAAVEREVPGCLLLQIHDSLVTEHDDTPEGAAEAQKVSDIGQRVFQEYFNVRGRVMDFGIKPKRWDQSA